METRAAGAASGGGNAAPARRRPRPAPWKRSATPCCAICGKARADRPWPASWPAKIKLYHDLTMAHAKCLAATQRLRTDVVFGSIEERWKAAPPLGSPRKTLREHRRRKKSMNLSAASSHASPNLRRSTFCSTVREPPRVKRTGDSLSGKVRVELPPPPPNALLNPGSQKQVTGKIEEQKMRKHRERAAFLRTLPPTKTSRETPLVIPKHMGLRPTTPQLVVRADKRRPVIRVLTTEEELPLRPTQSRSGSKTLTWKL